MWSGSITVQPPYLIRFRPDGRAEAPFYTVLDVNRSSTIMPTVLPARLSADARTATWNPALTRETHVTLEVRTESGEVVTRTSMNSGRAKVRESERIERVVVGD